ncbi:MAG: sulfurtransferase [Chloroflexi bacterium]|nr:sulfurtransferase [Chloroflexota bacterium]
MAAATDLLVDPGWLEDHLGQPCVAIADCRYDADLEKAHSLYLSGHIPGAVHVYWPRDLSLGTDPVPFLLPTPAQAAAILGRLGIGNETLVVGYDQEGDHFAARLWLLLSYLGNDRFRLLEGGIQKWIAEGRPVAHDDVVPTPIHYAAASSTSAIRVTKDELRRRLGEPGLVLADVRRESEFLGAEARAARGGRIPGARHVFWQDNLRADWSLKTPEEIRVRHEAAGIRPDQEVITYCQAVVRAAHTALALRLAGYPNVRVYDGSWAEWGADPDLPIEVG